MKSDIIMIVNGIEGEANDDEFPKSIELQTWQWGITQQGVPLQIQSAMREDQRDRTQDNRVAVQNITITKYCDESSTKLLTALFTNRTIKDIKIVNRKVSGQTTDARHTLTYLTVTLKDCVISSYQPMNSSTVKMTSETYSIAFSEIALKYQRQEKLGDRGATNEAKWNVAMSKVV